MVKHALIIGATSIAGYELAKLLLLQGDWKVSGTARSTKDYARIEGYNIIETDLLRSDEDVRKDLDPHVKDVTHVFFMMWIHKRNPEEEVQVNSKLFHTVTNCVGERSSCLEHIYLQTGSKYYAMHLGPKGGMKTPCKEDDPRVGTNFYYSLEDQAVEFATRKDITWSVARPPCLIGFTVDTAMNLGTSFAVYALVMKELGKPLIFPYGEKAYQCFRELAHTKLLARFIFWLVDENCPQNKNQAFNVTNGDLYRMETLWQKIADYFGLEVQVTDDKNFKLSQFMNENKQAWHRIVERHGLQKYGVNNLGTWDFMEQMLKRDWDEFMLVNKSLQFGWIERKDTLNVLENFFDELGLRKIIPLQAGAQVEEKARARRAIKQKQRERQRQEPKKGERTTEVHTKPSLQKTEPTRG